MILGIYGLIIGHPYDPTSDEIINCDDEEDCAAGSGSGLGPPSIVIGNGDDDSYEPSITGNEESEEFSYPKGSESGKCMSLRLIGLQIYKFNLLYRYFMS